MKGILPETDLL